MMRCRSARHDARGVPAHGFTLVEVLVALTILALMAALTWRGIDGIARAQAITSQSTDQTLALQAGLTQWHNDLDASVSWPMPVAGTPGSASAAPLTTGRSLVWDGSALRLTRTDAANPAAGLHVVAWTRQSSTGWWLRWQSAPFTSTQAWAAAWNAAAQWGQSASLSGLDASTGGGAQAVAIVRISDWRLYYFRNNAWSNPLSSAAEGVANSAGANPAATGLPGGIRLLLTLASGAGIAGPLTVDWVRPTFVGNGS
jgi:general secretion pathway protein J